MEEQRHIAFAADRDFQVPLALALYSLERALERPECYCIHIVHQGLDEAFFSPLGLELHFYDMGEALRDLPAQGRFPTPVYYRFLLPDLLPESIACVLYLDCDIMVQRDLGALWETSLEGKVLAACPWLVYGAHREAYQEDVHGFSARLGFPDAEPVEHYYYSSLLLMDLTRMRQQRITQQLIACSRAIPAERLYWPDQDVLNHVLRGRIATVPLSYNVIPLFALDMSGETQEAREAYAQPHLIHFAATKPNILTGAKLPFEEAFFTLWQTSPWARCIPYPLVSLRRMPRWLRCAIELPIRCGIAHEGFLRLYGRLLQTLRP